MEGVGLREGKQDDTEDFLVLTPSIGLDVANDGLGQQYRTPEMVALECGCDIIVEGAFMVILETWISMRSRGRRKGTGKQGGMLTSNA